MFNKDTVPPLEYNTNRIEREHAFDGFLTEVRAFLKANNIQGELSAEVDVDFMGDQVKYGLVADKIKLKFGSKSFVLVRTPDHFYLETTQGKELKVYRALEIEDGVGALFQDIASLDAELV